MPFGKSCNMFKKEEDPSLDCSIILPLYNEEESIYELHEHLHNVLQSTGLTYEIIYIDDGSTDRSAELVEALYQKHGDIKFIQFRRNYGKSAALSAGFKAARGQFVITMDADLQDDPAEIPVLIAKLEEGYDLVSGWKKVRRDPLSKRLASRIYNFFTSVFSGIRLHDFNCGLKAYRHQVIKSIDVYGEMHRYLPVMAFRDGFRVTEIPVRHHPRKYGKSKYGAARFLRGAFDLITITFLTRYKKRPLHLFGLIGALSVVIGCVVLIILTIQRIFYQLYLSNRPILFLGVLMVIVGIQFISIGLLGEMITAQRQGSDHYSVKRTLGI